ncbi:MAG TPA: endonuclease/exonuclease/phosphatase family protein [Gemmataceae bacterium]|nr:endonuclease/exonuclease/phosphatase family protein [Gemmataceae bacterium]
MNSQPTVIACRGCGQKLRVPPERFGQPGKCPKCGRTFPAIGRAGGRRWTGRLTAAYVAGVAVALGLVWAVGEDWWPGTLLLYAPRWPVLLPLFPIGLAAAAYRRRALVPLVAAGTAWVWWGMGLAVGGAFAERVWPVDGLVVITWNANGHIRDWDGFRTLLATEAPDLVLFQECDAGEAESAVQPGWTVARSPSGLAAASPHPVRFVAELHPNAFRRPGSAALFEVSPAGRDVRVLNVHLPTARPGLEDVFGRGPGGLAELKAVTADQDDASETARVLAAAPPHPLVVAGDFNLPPESRVFRRHWGDLPDAFTEAGFGFGWTKETSWHGARIDHVLHDRSWTCQWCRVGPALGSDHRPVIAHVGPVR